MNSEIRFTDKRLLEALEYIDEKYIDDVFDILKEPDLSNGMHTKISPLRHWRQYLALAACLILLAFATPIFGYVAEYIGSFAAGTSGDTSSITTEFKSESTEPPETTQKELPDFQYSDVKIIADGNKASINPVSVRIGYSWYKDEKSVWSEKVGWQYIIGEEVYKYENLPHLSFKGFLSSYQSENISLTSFKVYNANWEELEYSFDTLLELSGLPVGDYIIVGIEQEKIPYEKPHSVVGEYDYKLKESAVIFAVTPLELTVNINGLEYLKFSSDLEEIDYDTMIAVKNAWAGFMPWLQSDYPYNLLFNSTYFSRYGYLGRIGQSVVIATFTLKERKPISMEIVYDLIIEIYVYTDGNIISLEEAYETKVLTFEEMEKFKNRSKDYDNFRGLYGTREFYQSN